MATKLHMMWYLNAIIHRFYNVLFTIDIKNNQQIFFTYLLEK